MLQKMLVIPRKPLVYHFVLSFAHICQKILKSPILIGLSLAQHYLIPCKNKMSMKDLALAVYYQLDLLF